MISNYLKVALRNLRRHLGHTVIAIAGLSVGLAAFLLISLLVLDELGYDRFHDNSDRLYRVVEVRSSPELSEIQVGYTAGALADAAVSKIPEVAGIVKMIGSSGVGRRTVEFRDRRFYESRYLLTDNRFFDLFSFELLRGNPETALAEPGSVVLTRSGAEKYFGSIDPYGKTLTMEQFGDLLVTGIMADPPGNSHLQFNMLLSYSTINANPRWLEFTQRWDNGYFLVYVELVEGTDADAVTAKLASLMSANIDDGEGKRSPFLQPITDIHFGSSLVVYEHNVGEGDEAYLFIFGAIAIFLVAIGAINYMNMATARSMRRAREVGLRKVVGGHQGQLVRQFLTESVVASLFASIIALVLASLLLPTFVAFTGRDLSLAVFAQPQFALGLLFVTIFVGLVSGSYPAFYLSRFRPAHVLSGGTVSGRSATRLRRVLVVTQFTISIVMIVATGVVYDQLQYVQERRLGFNQDRLVVVDINNGDVRRDWLTVRAAFAAVPSVQSVSTTSRVPGDWKDMTQIDVASTRGGGDELITMSYMAIDDAFFATYEIDLIEGRPLSDAYGSDSSAVVINEVAATMLGFDLIDGSVVSVPGVPFEGRVVGVVRDFHFRSLHEEIGPLVLGYWNNPIRVIDYFTIRVAGNDLSSTIAQLKEVGESFDPSHPFEYNILDDRLGDLYQEDETMGTLFGVAALLAILIACLGLAGLASYTAEQRTKEIGVRKVLGASVRAIVVLMSRDFVVLVAIAFIIATPVAYLAMDRWLSEFAYSTDLSISVFVLAGLATLVVALLTVSYQAIRSAIKNPIDSLRYE